MIRPFINFYLQIPIFYNFLCVYGGWEPPQTGTNSFYQCTNFRVHKDFCSAHKTRVLMSSTCTGAKISAKTPFCQAVYKIQIRTNPQCLMSAIATFNSLFFKAIPCKSVQYWVPMFKLQHESAERAVLQYTEELFTGFFPLVTISAVYCWNIWESGNRQWLDKKWIGINFSNICVCVCVCVCVCETEVS